ncbi:GspE/PulE family protein [Ottowia sp.]|jgi:general secretion pathway protein E|uniref:GspE/PulE family protein n=1 Tax=Ottowia sp. TaxID=1898956 RepID=UPI0025E60485|nr:type II/IV secretion system protein [Ottowia sp.]MBK6615796.1 Flp pilus assembly complex ATPase component TadA [Ottowia sp.]MBK6746843.1 Flp pilus assembly complex ATPase component TadA [Ottowia sp.]
MKRATRPAPLAPAAGYAGLVQWRHLVEWMREDGVITADEAERTIARCAQAESAQPALVRLAAVGVARASDGAAMGAEELTKFLARRAGLGYLRIDPLKVDVGKVADSMSTSYAERHKVLPVQVSASEVVVATSEPFDDDWVAEVERQSRRRVRRVVANPADIKRYTAEFFALARSVRAAQKSGGASGAASFEQLVELGRAGRQLDANDQGVIQVVDWLWQYAFGQRASDIHLEPRRDQGVIRFRIDGVLHPVYQVPPGVMNAITARVKLLGRMDVVEKRRPQDGRIKTRSPSGEEIEMRLSTLPTAFGEKLVMRIFDPDTAIKDLAALGFTPHDAGRWEVMARRPHGIILVTGPTGSGKTTTLYSTLRRVATEEVNVSTIEDPIERIEPMLNQTQVQPQLDFSFAEGVRALMRQDPDIIMIGEIRDLETAEMAVQAALTGHLVFSTLHTNDAPSALTRLMELGVPAYLLNATILGVLAQRLVRTLCPACRQPDDRGTTEVLAEAVRPWKINAGNYRPYKPMGCVDCRMTGFRGRMGIYELLTVSEAFRALVQQGVAMAPLRKQAVADGMRPLRLAGAMRAAEGLTTLEEAVSATPSLE